MIADHTFLLNKTLHKKLKEKLNFFFQKKKKYPLKTVYTTSLSILKSTKIKKKIKIFH